uniref:Phosphorylase b kinase regulatory subunit n=1 Tax=Strongyloides venezuelensis TaxID=75913 RepID=A0A0K0F7E7_STRVS
MFTREESRVRLGRIFKLLDATILEYQHPITGLFENNPTNFPNHAWVRDNLYAVQALWALYRAYKKCAYSDEEMENVKKIGYSCIKIMQSIMECMIRQADKVELFKLHQRPHDALHAKYSVINKKSVSGDLDWGHHQIDAVSLFLLTLAQMTASGLQIVRNFDEVAFIQNLVYYIEIAYRTPDYGIWERGDKTNQGITELNSSSVGLAKAAMHALREVGDLFSDGSKSSCIHIVSDEIEQCDAVLSSMLPRESFSKEVDAALLSMISFPAFAVADIELITKTRAAVLELLYGKYGCIRFIRDGYKTVLEDPNRLHYNNSELQNFENIECEWPLFLLFLIIDSYFNKDEEKLKEYWTRLDRCLVTDENNKDLNLVPELYRVPLNKVQAEKRDPKSQEREVGGLVPFVWAQSLYIICLLLRENLITAPELDPLSRRLAITEKRPPSEVQVVILAETLDVKQQLAERDIEVQTLDEIDPIFTVQPASVFQKILGRFGECNKLQLTGRPEDRDIGLLTTSILYQIGQKFVVFTPQFMDRKRSHLFYDIRILMDEWASELQYIYTSWNSANMSGRPLVVLVVSKHMLHNKDIDEKNEDGLNSIEMKATVIDTILKIKNGYIDGSRVVMGHLHSFFRTTAISKLHLHDHYSHLINHSYMNGSAHRSYLDKEEINGTNSETPRREESEIKRSNSIKDRKPKQFNVVHETSLRHRSMIFDSNDVDLIQLRLAYNSAKMNSNNSIPSSPDKLIETLSETRCSTSPMEIPANAPEFLASEYAASPFGEESWLTNHQKNELIDMSDNSLIDLLNETNILEEQASIIHCLWIKRGPNCQIYIKSHDASVSVRELTEEVYRKACIGREWTWVRISAGLLDKQMDELTKNVTHLMVRQKQLTVGSPSKTEEAITCPKTREELRIIIGRAYRDDKNGMTLAQEVIVALGSLVRTDPKLFIEMFRLRIGLIVQVMASELARIKHLGAEEASLNLLHLSPFEVKEMIHALLSGRLLEETSSRSSVGVGIREKRTGMESFRKQIEERKSLRRSLRSVVSKNDNIVNGKEESSDDSELDDDYQYGIWLRHRRIDGALNRVPQSFYATIWSTLRRFYRGITVGGHYLDWSLTQEMTTREIKFSLQVEHILNQIVEPEYREILVEAFMLLGNVDKLIQCAPRIDHSQPFELDRIVRVANALFVEHNREMNTIVMECCGSNNFCDGARGICQYFYDSAPAGEYGTAHYMIKALMDLFASDF